MRRQCARELGSRRHLTISEFMNTEVKATRATAAGDYWVHHSLKAAVRNVCIFLFTLLATITFSGCVSEPEEPSHIRAGMTRDDLRFFFGEPLRIERVENGGEVWYYRVVTANTPMVEGAAWEGPVPGDGGVAVGVSPTPKVKMEAPIFLSPEGRVMDPVPIATIRGR